MRFAGGDASVPLLFGYCVLRGRRKRRGTINRVERESQNGVIMDEGTVKIYIT